ncbi:hypothetical protein BGW38_004105, partial [Lunasporangiospora selenospora]
MVDLTVRTETDGSLQGAETDYLLQGTRAYSPATNRKIARNTKVAVILVGNKGAGKSALLSQLGGRFKSAFSFMESVTKDVKKQQVKIDGQPITLIDTPGLYEIDSSTTELNSRKLTEVLREDFHFKIFFVLTGHSRAIPPEDLALMSRVNQAIRDTRGAKVEFRVIVNQIRGDEEYQNYKTVMTLEKLQEFLDSIPNDSEGNASDELLFNILVKDILLLRHDEKAINNNGFKSQLIPYILDLREVGLRVDPIRARADDVELLRARMKGYQIGAILVIGAALAPLTAVSSIVACVICHCHVMTDSIVGTEAIEQTRTAVMFIGNPGVGKSTLSSQLGGNFKSGFSLIEGMTTDVAETEVEIRGERVVLIDTPGLYSFTDGITELNCKKLTEALEKRGYYYKLFFVVAGTSRSISAHDLALMSRVNQSVRAADGTNVEFKVIVNQIHGDKEYDEYQKNMSRDRLQKYLDSLRRKMDDVSFNIRIKDVLLLRYDEYAVANNGMRSELESQILDHTSVQLRVNLIQARHSDINKIKEAIKGVVYGVAVTCAIIFT